MALQYPLHVAAGQGDLTAIKALVGTGADINAKDDNGVSTYKGNLMKTLLFDIITKGFSSPKCSAKHLFLSMKGEAKDLVNKRLHRTGFGEHQVYYISLTLCCL